MAARFRRWLPVGLVGVFLLSVVLLPSGSAAVSALGEIGAVVTLLGFVVLAALALWPELFPKTQDVPASLREEVAQLSALAGVPAPRIRVIQSGVYNAHARSFRGRDRITVSSAALDRSSLSLTGLIAHELAHIVNGDIRLFRRVIVPMACPGMPAALFLVANLSPEHALTASWFLLGGWLLFLFRVLTRTELRAECVGARLVGPDALVASLAEVGTHSRFAELWPRLLGLPTTAQRHAAIERGRAAMEAESSHLGCASRQGVAS